MEERFKENGVFLKGSTLLVSSSVSGITWDKELGDIGIKIYLGDKSPTFEMEVLREYRRFTNTKMIEAQENRAWREHSIYKGEIDRIS